MGADQSTEMLNRDINNEYGPGMEKLLYLERFDSGQIDFLVRFYPSWKNSGNKNYYIGSKNVNYLTF